MKHNIFKIGIFTSLLVIFSWISIPLPFGVPFTLQVFGIFLVSFFLKKDAWKVLIVYLILGTIGLPVFSNFTGGIGRIFGPTGGFLLGFLFSSFIPLFIKNKRIFTGIFQLLIIYTFGVLWFTKFTDFTLLKSFQILVPTFIFWDILKLFLAFIVVTSVEKRLGFSLNKNSL